MITKATASQWRQIAALRDSIIAGITNQPDDESIRAVVHQMWQRLGVTPKAVLISDCPITGALFFVWLKTYSQLDSQLDSQLRSQLYSQLDSQFYVSIFWRVWSGWYEGAKLLGVQFDPEKYETFIEWTLHIPVICANAAVPVVSRFPTSVKWKDGRLHNEVGMAVEFRSGWGLWALEGIPVDEQLVMHPETQTIEQLDGEKNLDLRAIRIHRFGWPRYIKESGAVLRQERYNEVEGTREALFRCKDGSQRLVVTCPTGRIFALGVPGEVTTCEQAQNWLGSEPLDTPSRCLFRT